MTTRSVETQTEREMVMKLIASRKLPFTVSIADGKHRSTEQNKLQRLWMKEISEQLGDRTPEEVRGYCKLVIGVPILRAENDLFREKYDAVLKPLSYEQKISIMMLPLDLPVTRIMTTKQKTEYLDGVQRHFAEMGVVLTEPSPSLAESGDAGGAGAQSASRSPSTEPMENA